jgi:dTDP-4-dehydrorhamnose reductase
METIVVLGSNGMLGRAVASIRLSNRRILEINRKDYPAYKQNMHLKLKDSLHELENQINFKSVSHLINCAGMIRQKMVDESPATMKLAVNANTLLPLQISALSEKYGFNVIQIGTDCVYSGKQGSYLETDPHDPVDLYGKSKSLGEIPYPKLALIRCSIIGFELNSNYSLLNWVLSQKENASVSGYTDQIWNGVTVHHFAKLVAGVVQSDEFDKLVGVHHFLPSNTLSKFELIKNIASSFKRPDLRIQPTKSGINADMTLATNSVETNDLMWKLAGYTTAPSIEEMVLEYSRYIQSGGNGHE